MRRFESERKFDYAGVLILFWLFSILLSGCDDSETSHSTAWTEHGYRLLTIQEPSGLAYDSTRHSLWVVDDSDASVSEMTTEGTVIRTLDYEGDDPEGIAIHPDGQSLFVVEEHAGDIVQIDTTGAVLHQFHLTEYESGTNRGFEGITYYPPEDRLYLVREADPVIVVVMDMNGAIRNRIPVDFAPDLSGITYDPSTDEFLMLSDEAEKVYHMTPSGDLLFDWSIDIDKAEGITIHGDTLYIVSDSESTMYVFTRGDDQ